MPDAQHPPAAAVADAVGRQLRHGQDEVVAAVGAQPPGEGLRPDQRPHLAQAFGVRSGGGNPHDQALGAARPGLRHRDDLVDVELDPVLVGRELAAQEERRLAAQQRRVLVEHTREEHRRDRAVDVLELRAAHQLALARLLRAQAADESAEPDLGALATLCGDRVEPEAIDLLSEDAPEVAVDDERLAAIRHCVEQLAPRSREAMDLRYSQSLPPSEVAGRMQLGLQSVHVMLSRARAAVQQCAERVLRRGKGAAE